METTVKIMIYILLLAQEQTAGARWISPGLATTDVACAPEGAPRGSASIRFLLEA